MEKYILIINSRESSINDVENMINSITIVNVEKVIKIENLTKHNSQTIQSAKLEKVNNDFSKENPNWGVNVADELKNAN